MTTTTRQIPPTTKTRATGPVQCAPWCGDGDGHTRAGFREDQHCDSVQQNITASLHEPWEMNDDTTEPAHLIALVRKYPDSEAHVVIVTPEDREFTLTPHEARELARSLRHFAWVAAMDQQVDNAFRLGVDAGRLGLTEGPAD